MTTEVEDVNAAGAESSTTPPDAQADSSTATTTTAESSPAGAKEPSSISEALEKVQLEQPPEEAGGPQGEELQSAESPTTGAESGEAQTEEAGAKDKPPGTEAGAADLDAPFDTRQEWRDAVKIGGDKIKPILRTLLQNETRARETLNQMKPFADETHELRQLVGGENEFKTMKNLVRGFAGGDPAVLPILKQMVQTIEKLSGETLSSQDLMERATAVQQQLDDGLIDQSEFDTQTGLLKEIERNRAGKRSVEARLQTTEQTQRQQAEKAQSAQAEAVINSWESNIRSRDPDFGNVTDLNDPKHGESVADQVFDAMILKRTIKPEASTDELITAAQRAYTLARGRVPGPGARQQRVVTSQSSSITGRQRPKTMREAMDSVRLE